MNNHRPLSSYTHRQMILNFAVILVFHVLALLGIVALLVTR